MFCLGLIFLLCWLGLKLVGQMSDEGARKLWIRIIAIAGLVLTLAVAVCGMLGRRGRAHGFGMAGRPMIMRMHRMGMMGHADR